ncbi:MAG: peptidyl-prolyl cis-trans isomerase [Candidatus Coatesbacteria bacterium]|nr:peptidyl-prolyl cis-trans isomerase [Candidatus Coatesbacteria bacterium]
MAMLAMRKHLKKLSIFLWIIIAAFIGTIFVVWGAGRQGMERSEAAIASVNGDQIFREEYTSTLRRYTDYYREIYKDRLTPDLLKNLDLENRVLQDLIRKRLMLQEANNLGILVTDAEVESVLRKTRGFQDENGNFRPDLYMRILSMNRIAPEIYEQGIRQSQRASRLEDFIRATVRVTDEEVRAKYLEESEKVNCKYVEFRGRDLAKDLEPSDTELKELYSSQKENYKSEREVKVEYILFSPDAYKSKVSLTDGEVQDYYDTHESEYVQEEQVQARHILVKVDSDAGEKADAEAKKKIEGLLARVKAGEDFANLAKEYSDCPSSSKGGDLGYFGRGQMAKPFEEAAFALEVGEMSGVVKTQFGYHIIMVEGRKPPETKEFAQVEGEIREKLTKEKALELAREAAEAAHEKLGDSNDLAALAQENGLKLTTTDFFKRSDEIEGLGRSYQFANAALGLAKDAVSTAVKGRDRYFLIKMLDEKPPIVLPFEEVKDKVKRDWRRDEGEKIAEEKANEFAKKVTDAASFEKTAKDWDLSVKETNQFSKDGYIRGIGRSEEFAEKAFEAKVGDIGGPIKVRDRYLFFTVLEHTRFDQSEFDKVKGQMKQQVRAEKENEALGAWIEDLKSKAKIDIDPLFVRKQQPASPPGAAS